MTLLRRALKAALLPMSTVYGAGVWLHRAWRRRLPAWNRKIPVVLVGNITVGGTGKTPLVALLAEQFVQTGFRPAIISRGYGGRRGVGPAVVSNGSRVLLGPLEAGDEPWMLARMLPGVPVVVGADRVSAAALAVDQLSATVLVLDDAFQQRERFPSGFRVVTLNAADPFGNGALLPAGTLREPTASLGEAQTVVLTHVLEVDAAALHRVKARVASLAPQAVKAAAAHEIQDLESAADGSRQPREWLRGKRVLALSAIGYPAGFQRALTDATGVEVVSRTAPDHYVWRERDLRHATQLAASRGCEVIVTTAKDVARLPRGATTGPPMYIARLKLAWVEGESELHAALFSYLKTYA